MIYTIEKITTLIGAHRYGTAPAKIGSLLTDSRSLRFPEESLFFAMKSERNDGHRYIAELYRRSVRSFVVEQLPDHWQQLYPDANFLKVPHSLNALQRLAERHRDEFQIPVIGITGSNGKTVVKEWLYQMLMSNYTVTRSPRSYNSQIGVPLSVWLLNEHSQIGLFEAGISQVGEMQALAGIIQPTIGIITSIGQAHQENFESLEQKCREKLLLFKDAHVVFYPEDDAMIAKCVKALTCKKIAWKRYEGKLPYIDRASQENAGCVAAVARYFGLDDTTITKRLQQLEPVAMRLEVKNGQRGCILINDSYNSDINSLDIALDFMQRRREQSVSPTHTYKDDGSNANGQDNQPLTTVPFPHKDMESGNNANPWTTGGATLILSDIEQSGIPQAQLYSEVSKLCQQRGIEKFIGIGSELSEHQTAIDIDEKYFFESTEEFLWSEVFEQLHDELILVKGARSFGFDRITEQLEQKVHETILEVNLSAVVQNLNFYRSFLKPETKIVCMVKADAYGAGAVEVAKTLQDHRADYLAVAVADEGVTLRKAGITANIMVMNPETTAFKTMFDYSLEPEIYSFRLLDLFIRAARKEGIAEWPVHIKLDTGMHRLGFNAEESAGEIDRLIDMLKHQQAVVPRSVFSHFVGSDSDDFDRFSTHQFEIFDKASQRLQDAFPHKILRHICNSAGIEHFPERQLDMCRLGLGLYGIDSRDNRILNNVSTLKTTILQLRHVPKEDTVGYSRKGILHRDSVIAAIPIGYADGLNRHLGCGNGYCLVNGQKAPYVGNICMDVAMIDVTDIPCREGDTVEIFGDHLPVTVLSDSLKTIPYEVLTGISNRVKRIYFQD